MIQVYNRITDSGEQLVVVPVILVPSVLQVVEREQVVLEVRVGVGSLQLPSRLALCLGTFVESSERVPVPVSIVRQGDEPMAE